MPGDHGVALSTHAFTFGPAHEGALTEVKYPAAAEG